MPEEESTHWNPEEEEPAEAGFVPEKEAEDILLFRPIIFDLSSLNLNLLIEEAGVLKFAQATFNETKLNTTINLLDNGHPFFRCSTEFFKSVNGFGPDEAQFALICSVLSRALK